MVLYFDTETTSIRPGQICQLSYILQDKSCAKAKNFFFTVDSVDSSAYAVHGFSVNKLRLLSGGRRFVDYFSEIEQDFNSADLIVAHNCNFDVMFMSKEFERLGKVFYLPKSFCTMRAMTPVCKLKRTNSAGYKYPKLSELCDYFGVNTNEVKEAMTCLFGEITDFHDARFDTTALYLLVNKGLPVEKALGIIKEKL